MQDGEPSDIDVHDGTCPAEHARRAAQAISHNGIGVLGFALESEAHSGLSRNFGNHGLIKMAQIDALPERLPEYPFRVDRMRTT